MWLRILQPARVRGQSLCLHPLALPPQWAMQSRRHRAELEQSLMAGPRGEGRPGPDLGDQGHRRERREARTGPQ